MKKAFFFAALLAVAATFTACSSSGTPKDDKTNLWPAMDANGKMYGYIDSKGTMAIPAMYERTAQFSCGYGRATLAGNYYFLNKSGKTADGAPNLSDGCNPYFYYNCLGYCVNGKWGMLDNSFKTIIQPAYDWLGYMSADGLVAAKQGEKDKYCFLNKKGETAIAANFDGVESFYDGVAAVQIGDKYGAIDTKGQYVINATYDALWSIGEGRLAFVDAKAEKRGMMDNTGIIIVQPIYDRIGNFADNGLCPVEQNEKYGYINKSGELKIACQYEYASPFYEGYAWIQRTETSKYELIDVNGNNVLTLSANEVPYSVFHNGLCLITNYSSDDVTVYKYIDIKGTMIYTWSIKYDYDAPARMQNGIRVNEAEMFAATQYGPLFNRK